MRTSRGDHKTIIFGLLALVVYLVTVVPMKCDQGTVEARRCTGQSNIRLPPVRIRSNQLVRERI
jgi:hypothetical protein